MDTRLWSGVLRLLGHSFSTPRERSTCLSWPGACKCEYS